MNKEQIQEEIESIILHWQDDIQEYLNSEIPLECYPEDIDKKLDMMRAEIGVFIDKTLN